MRAPLLVLAAGLAAATLAPALPASAHIASADTAPAAAHTQEGDYPPLTLERINAHRQGIIDTVRQDRSKAYRWSMTLAKADGLAIDGVLASTETILFTPSTGMLSGSRVLRYEDGTTKTTERYRCVSKKVCWMQEQGRKWKRISIVFTVTPGGGYSPDAFVVQETLSENSAVIADTTGETDQTVTITLEDAAMTAETVGKFLGIGPDDIRLTAGVAVATAVKVRATAKKSVTAGKPTMAMRFSF